MSAGTAPSPTGLHRLERDIEERAQRFLSETPRPFLKWAGSKRALIRHFVSELPDEYNTYYEPFMGSGSLFFLLKPSRARLGDVCAPLVATYEAVRDDPQGVLEQLSSFEVSPEAYYQIRAEQPTQITRRAAQFIYLNKVGWNGLYRVNAKGQFNVPYGRPKTTNLGDPQNILHCSEVLKCHDVQLDVQDFQTTLAGAGRGDLIFLDPPYVTGHENNGFIDYNERLFSWHDQERLAQVARDLVEKGAHVLVTNASHDNVRALYADFKEVRIERSSTLAGASKARRAVHESVFVSHAR